jgi:hypothetical protein
MHPDLERALRRDVAVDNRPHRTRRDVPPLFIVVKPLPLSRLTLWPVGKRILPVKQFALCLTSLIFLVFPAAAQERVSAQSGQEVRAGWIGSVGENCAANAAPEVTAGAVAQHGQIKLRKATVQTNSIPSCPGVKIPAVVVFYTSAPGFKGIDSFTLSTGSSQPGRTYTINVE